MDQSEFVPGVGDLQLVGRGATAAVFRSHDVSDGRTIAVKVLNVRLIDAAQIGRFERDFAVIAELNSEQSIVEVLASGVNGSGHPWLVAPYMPDNLADVLIRSGRIPWEQAAVVGAQIAGGLAAAHRRGVLHGDLKPGDIRFDDRGVAHLSDLGLARYSGAAATNSNSADARLAHCAPEVASGRRLDERTDIYSLASVLYEAIAGTPPFGRLGDLGAPVLVDRILTVAAASLAPAGVPQALDELLLRALSKDPSDRPASAAGFADALTTSARTAPTMVPPAVVAPQPTYTSATSPLLMQDLAFDELATPPDGYPLIDEFPVLDAIQAAPLLAAAGRRELRRRRERRAVNFLAIAAFVAVLVGGGIVLLTRDNSHKSGTATDPTSTRSSVASDDTATPGVESLQTVGTVTYAFTASFDSGAAMASLSGMASPTGESRLKNALIAVGRLDNTLDIQDGPEPDGGAAVDDAVTLISAMRRDLVAGVLTFDGQTFSLNGFYRDVALTTDLQNVIALIRTPVGRPGFTIDPNAAATPTSSPVTVTGTGPLAMVGKPASFTIPGDGNFHVFPLTLVPTGGVTSLCLSQRNVVGPRESALTMNYSSCGLARIVTMSSSYPGTYTVRDTFITEEGPNGPTGTITFVVVVT